MAYGLGERGVGFRERRGDEGEREGGRKGLGSKGRRGREEEGLGFRERKGPEREASFRSIRF